MPPLRPRRPIANTAWPLLVLGLGCSRAPATGAGPAPGISASAQPQASSPASASASADGLVLTWEIGPEIVTDRVPLRTAKLRFRNAGTKPLRIFLPQAEPFRSPISDLSFTVITGPHFSVPEPRPHGYVITEVDFPEIAPGEEKVFLQTFTLDPFGRGGAAPARRTGFENGRMVAVTWTYQNRSTAWPGGTSTLDGVTKPLFGGGPIPGLWTGKLEVRGIWIIPD